MVADSVLLGSFGWLPLRICTTQTDPSSSDLVNHTRVHYLWLGLCRTLSQVQQPYMKICGVLCQLILFYMLSVGFWFWFCSYFILVELKYFRAISAYKLPWHYLLTVNKSTPKRSCKISSYMVFPKAYPYSSYLWYLLYYSKTLTELLMMILILRQWRI